MIEWLDHALVHARVVGKREFWNRLHSMTRWWATVTNVRHNRIQSVPKLSFSLLLASTWYTFNTQAAESSCRKKFEQLFFYTSSFVRIPYHTRSGMYTHAYKQLKELFKLFKCPENECVVQHDIKLLIYSSPDFLLSAVHFVKYT